MSDAVFATDAEGRISFWGRGAERLYRVPGSEALGRRLADLLHVRWGSPEEERAAREALANQDCWRGENVHVLASGAEIPVESTVCVLRGEDGCGHGLLAVVHDVSEHRRAEERLRESREQLRALASRIQAVREEEKARVARDLHDELGSVLTALRIELRDLEAALERVEPARDAGPLLDRVVEASTLVNWALAAVKRIALELRPGALDRLGLAAALRQEIRRFTRRTGLDCDADLPDSPPVELEAGISTALYRIWQEAMTNVVRHAHATHVQVRLDVGRDEVTLEIEDDGRGIDPSRVARPYALGMLGMKERAKALGGEVSFGGRRGRGTIVTARIPLRHDRVEPGPEARSSPDPQDLLA